VETGMVGYGLGYWELSDAINLVEDASGDQIPNMLAWMAHRIATIT
jgi:hypothetical protein